MPPKKKDAPDNPERQDAAPAPAPVRAQLNENWERTTPLPTPVQSEPVTTLHEPDSQQDTAAIYYSPVVPSGLPLGIAAIGTDIVVVCDDGSVWKRNLQTGNEHEWTAVRPIPNTEASRKQV